MEHEKNNSSPQENAAEINAAQVYEIRVKGCMDQVFWTDWFGGMEISMDANQEETTLRGTLADQAELYGLLSRLRNKGLTLISIQQVQQEKEDRSGDEK